MTRGEAAARIGVSVSEIRRREAAGQLKPKKRNANGWNLYAPEDIEEQVNLPLGTDPLPRRTAAEPFTPEEATQVFNALDAGKSLVDCVRECLIMPSVVEALAVVYARLTGGMFLHKATMDAINGLPLEGAFPLKSEADLLEVLKLASTDSCRTCGTRARSFCKPCSLKLAAKAERNAV